VLCGRGLAVPATALRGILPAALGGPFRPAPVRYAQVANPMRSSGACELRSWDHAVRWLVAPLRSYRQDKLTALAPATRCTFYTLFRSGSPACRVAFVMGPVPFAVSLPLEALVSPRCSLLLGFLCFVEFFLVSPRVVLCWLVVLRYR